MAASSETSENSNVNSADETKSHACDTESNKVKLVDLKVSDLEIELEKRELDKNGDKTVLVERLKDALVQEGKDPDTVMFEITSNSPESKCETIVKSCETNGVIEDADETEQHNQEDKNNDVTLQISIDEEEAQFNEEENNVDVAKSIDNETENVNSENNVEQVSSELTVDDESVSGQELSSEQNSPVKLSKTTCEDSKEKKTLKSNVSTKNTETSSVSPKVLKVISKNDKIKSPSVLAKSLWITGLPNTIRAADIKGLFSKQGKVLSVKIVKSAKQTPGKCYGFVTMATSKDATKAIQNLHRTELGGRIISVEKTQGEPSVLLKKSETKLISVNVKKQTLKKEISTKSPADSTKPSTYVLLKEAAKSETKVVEAVKELSDDTKKKEEEKEPEKTKLKEKEIKPREQREKDRRTYRPPSGFRPRAFERPRFGNYRRPFGRRPFLNRSGFGSSTFRSRSNPLFEKIREERLHLRENFREREAERRRADEIFHHKYIERKQREEAYRLEREKEKLRIERELLERQRAEILKLEREKQRLERERLEREREELRCHGESRRSKRPYDHVERETDPFWDERKRVPRYDDRNTFPGEGSRYEYPSREHSSFSRHEFEHHSDRFSNQKPINSSSHLDYGDRDARREVTLHSREERPVFSRSDYRERDNRRSFSSRERERQSSRREPPRDSWKHERRVHERIVAPSSSSSQRRMTYY